MSLTTQDITNWIQIFINANSPDQAISKPANDSISDKINNGGDYLIGVISQILIVPEKDENMLTAKGYASSFLSQMLSIKNISELEINRKNHRCAARIDSCFCSSSIRETTFGD